MRIDRLSLTWFRGAAETVTLDTDGKSVVIYGENGSGKSSFVDAIEYLLNGGKIGHLAHEYSGKNQEKGLLNTHTKPGEDALIDLALANGETLSARLKPSGAGKRTGPACATVEAWDYHRTILRQDEVAAFIHDTKGGKYSSLLPLLGLHSLEVAAENLRQLTKSVEQRSPIREAKEALRQVSARRTSMFGEAGDTEVISKLKAVHSRFCPGGDESQSLASRCVELEKATAAKIGALSLEQKRYVAFHTVAALKLKDHIAAVRLAAQELSASVEPLVVERLEILGATADFAAKLNLADEVLCPSCGRSVPAAGLSAHVREERARLEQIEKTFQNQKREIAKVCQAAASLKAELAKPELKTWREAAAAGPLGPALAYLEALDVEVLRKRCDEEVVRGIEQHLLLLINEAAEATKAGPVDAKDLSDARSSAEIVRAIIEAEGLSAAARRAQTLIQFLQTLEAGVRQEIRARAKAVIDDISADIQAMWSILHPGTAIQETKLYFPDDVDKAIDVQLRFHGVLQDSPRLTLSEGYRNSLGLCIFLSMAKREAGDDRPLVLDDVVVSLDRNHRGMIVELLEAEFKDRQVVLLTHDREWYTELRHQLDAAHWVFKPLMPYEQPEVGIRWSARTLTFDDARALLKRAPDAAGNTARKIMDIELALLADRLKIRLPYMHGYKNDHRTGHEFISRLISDAPGCFKKKGSKQHDPYTEAVEGLRKAQVLLVTWGNKASHTFDMVAQEAEKLITTCEEALARFNCASCKKAVHRLDDTSSEFLQCHCGELRWRYGKG